LDSKQDYEPFKSMTFTLPSGKKGFKELLLDYLDQTISLSTIIKYEEAGKIVQAPLENLTPLLKVLNGDWKFILFDLDCAITEDNILQVQIREKREEHLIPFRSVLLETTWKDRPLSQKTIQRLLDSTERNSGLKHWIQRKDAPIYQRLSSQTQQMLTEELQPILAAYTLSKHKEMGRDATLKFLQSHFVEQLCVTTESNKKIWELLENSIFLPNSQEKKIWIAKQLFPRLTSRQQTALFERQTRRTQYLEQYRLLANSSLRGAALLEQMVQFLHMQEVPLSSIEKKQLLKELMDCLALPIALEQQVITLHEHLCLRCQPTYFNVMKAMYPLLADAYALNQQLYGDAIAGRNIGFYLAPLEEAIAKAQSYPSTSPVKELACFLEKQINQTTNPALLDNLDL